MMDYYGLLFMFAGLSFLTSMSSKNSAIGMIKKIGRLHCYPKGYVAPAKWVRKFFHIKQHAIPLFFCIELYLSLFYAILCPINMLICVIWKSVPNIGGILIMIQACLALLENFCLIIISYWFEKQSQKRGVNRDGVNRDGSR